MSNNGYSDKEVIRKIGAVGKEKCSKNKEKEQISQADKNETNGFYADFRSAFTRNERVELGNNNGYCHNEATRNIERGKKPKTSKIDEKRQISNIAAGRKSDHYEDPSSAFSRISIDHCNAQIKIGRKKMVRNLRSSEPQKISRFPRHHGEGKKVSPPALNLQWPGQKQVASAVAPQIRKRATPKNKNTSIHRNCRKHLRKEGDWWIVEGGQSHKKAAHSPLKTKPVNKEGNRKKYGRPPREVEGKWLTSLIAATTEAVLRQLGKGKSPTAHTKSNQSRVPLQHSEKTAKGIKHATPQPKKKEHEQRKELPRRPPTKRSHGANKGQGAPVRAPAKTQGKGEEQPHTMRTWAQVAAPKKQKVTSKPPMVQKKKAQGEKKGAAANPFHWELQVEQLLKDAEQIRESMYIRFLHVRQSWWSTCFKAHMEFHCPVCGFAHPEETITVTHCRQQHPQEGRLIPYTLTTTGNQVQFAGPSCSLSAVVAILSHMEEEKNFHPIIRRSYQSPSKETTQTLVQALGLELPTAPITAIEALAHHDQMIRQLLEAPATTARQCGHCGVNELMEGPSNPGENLGIISVNPNTCESIELTNQILAKTYTTSWTDMEVVCTGERKNMAHRPTPTLITHSKTFGEMVVIDIGTWGNEAVGLKRILHEILLPHGNGTATYKLVGAVIAPTPFHVVAAIPQQTRKRRWDILDGMVRRTVSQSTVDPKTVVMCVYRREEEETYDVLDEEEQDDDLLGIPNPTPRRLMISQAGPQQNSWVDTRGRRAYGSQEEQDERTSTDQVSIFSHDETRELSSPLECPIVGCTASFVGPRRWEKAKSHIYGVHSLEEVREIPGGELICKGIVRCETCATLLPTSDRAKQAHADDCRPYLPRKENIRRKRAAEREATEASAQQGIALRLERQGPYITPRDIEEPTNTTTESWWREKVATKRYLHRKEWPQWLDICRTVLLGYSASSQGERHQRQVMLLDLVRNHLHTRTARREQQQQRGKDNQEEEDRQKEEEKSLAKRVETLCLLSATGRAAQLLAAEKAQPVEYSPEMAQTIGELYPQEDIHDIPRPPVEQPGVVSVDAEEVAKTIARRLTRGAAPGLDGWTRELLYPLTLDPALKMEIAAVVKDIINADVSMEVGRRLQATSLTVLRKPNGKYRPIGAESVWAKLASHIAISRVMKTAEKKFSGIQFGVGGHIEEAIAKIRKDFATKGSLAMLDGRNAYNAISRRAILEAVYGDSTWSPLWRLVSLLLGTTGEVGFYENGKLCHTWESTRGVRQGMVLGPLLFSIGTLATLRRLQQTFPEAQFTAYLDDVTVAAPPEELKNVCAATAEAMEALGIVNNADKTEVLELTGDTGFGTAVKACARVLGAYVAPDPMSEEIREGVEKKAMETDRLFKAIVELPLYNRTRWRILAMSAMPRITFLLRNHDMQHTHQVASWFDERTTQVMEHILGQPMTERARNIAALPVSMGGCGIRRMAQVAEYAHQCAGEKGLQQRKTEEADQRQQDDLYATLGGADRQVFTANTAAGAGRPLTDAQVRLDDATFGVYLRERLLVRVLPEGVKCLCGEDASNHHIHTCTKVHNKPRQMRHDIINSVFANGLRLCGFQCATEPRLNEVSKRRPDILIAGLDTYAVTDITVTYPGRVTVGNTAQGQRSVAAADPMKAALVRFQEKERKYSYWAIQNGLAFAPFVMLTNGAIFGKSRDWLRRVLRGQDHRLTVTTAFDGITADVVAAVLRGNVHVYSAAQARGETLR